MFRIAQPGQFQDPIRPARYWCHGNVNAFCRQLETYGAPGRAQSPWEMVVEEEQPDKTWRRVGVIRKTFDHKVTYHPDPTPEPEPAPAA